MLRLIVNLFVETKMLHVSCCFLMIIVIFDIHFFTLVVAIMIVLMRESTLFPVTIEAIPHIYTLFGMSIVEEESFFWVPMEALVLILSILVRFFAYFKFLEMAVSVLVCAHSFHNLLSAPILFSIWSYAAHMQAQCPSRYLNIFKSNLTIRAKTYHQFKFWLHYFYPGRTILAEIPQVRFNKGWYTVEFRMNWVR